jgi:hypothetical protein
MEDHESYGGDSSECDLNQLGIDGFSFPNYMPIDKHLFREFEVVTKVSNPVNVDELISQTIETGYDYVDFIFKNEISEWDSQVLLDNCQVLRQLYFHKFQLDVLKQKISTSKQQVLEDRTSDDVLSLSTWKDYKEVEKLQFGDNIVQELSKNDNIDELFETWLKLNNQYQVFKYLPFILNHPEESLPEDTNIDDDLNVAGGKVSLKDPITLRIFSDPVISKCGHTYERDSILQQMTGNSTTCAISGCEAKIEKKDLKHDKIMEIRVKSFHHNQKFAKNDKVVPVLLT